MVTMNWSDWVALIALIIACAAGIIVILERRDIVTMRHTIATLAASLNQSVTVAESRGDVVVVYNPSKQADFDELKQILKETAGDAGLPEPVWVETTPEDSGWGQTREALKRKPSVVIAAGGDGTVRMVAGALAGSGVPMGLIPVGTGNLLARNVGLPLDSPRNMASIALTGRTRRVDIGWIEAPEETPELRAAVNVIAPDAEIYSGSQPFIVIAGMGFDAQVMDDTDPTLKRVMGWPAYVVSGMKHLDSQRVNAHLVTGEGDHRNEKDIEARSIMFANCGTLTGGLVLAPDARIDDGWLDIAVLDTKAGIFGWTDLARRIGLRQFGMRDRVLPETGSIEFRRTKNAVITAAEPELIQADGDALGWAAEVTARIEMGGVLLRVG
jgi:diacylglycerol kinase family enzyme